MEGTPYYIYYNIMYRMAYLLSSPVMMETRWEQMAEAFILSLLSGRMITICIV